MFIGGGFVLISSALRVLYDAQRRKVLATSGPYARIRHPQYMGFVLVMLGFLLQWPTLLTLLVFPVLVTMYLRLARTAEREAQTAFGPLYMTCMRDVPGFVPRFGSLFGQALT